MAKRKWLRMKLVLGAYYTASNLSLGYTRCRWFVGAEEMTVWLGGRDKSEGGGVGGGGGGGGLGWGQRYYPW